MRPCVCASRCSAEDNLTNQQVVAGMLEMLGCRAKVVTNGHEALEAWSQQPCDLILMDCQMPDMDGYEAARAVRQKEAETDSTARTPIVALTAYAMEGDRDRCLAAGMDDFLGKPFTIAQLRCLLERWVRKQSAANVPQQAPIARVIAGELESRTAAPPGSQGLVLVAEDEPVIQEVVVSMLRMAGCQVDAVANGREALKSMAQRRYDLVFMDCLMPELDGCQTARVIREKEAASQSDIRVPIIAISGGGPQSNRKQCLDAGMDDYLAKPFQMQQLQDVLAHWLCSGTAAGGRTPAVAAPETAGDPVPVAAALQVSEPAATVEVRACLDRQTLDRLRAIRGRDPKNFFAGLVKSYLRESRRLFEHLQDAIAGQDHEAAGRAAHSLKSSSGSLGAIHLAALCAEIEALADTKAINSVKDMLPRIAEEFGRVREALQDEI